MTSAKVIFEQQTVTFHSSFLKISSFYQSLSRIAGAKLTNNNPHIADLSDDNRPTKLAEKFGQLYDDAWTDSLEELTEVETKLEDTVAISFLLRIVMVSFLFMACQTLQYSIFSICVVQISIFINLIFYLHCIVFYLHCILLICIL